MEKVLSNGEEIKTEVINRIRQANQSIKVAMAFFTDNDIAEELISSKEKGVDVKVVISHRADNEKITSILENEVGLKVHSATGRGLMHHKFCIIDDAWLLHGSYNYTYNALKNNQETLNITDSQNLINDYTNIFNRLYYNQEQSNDNDADDEYDTDDENETNEVNDDKVAYLETFEEQLDNIIKELGDDFDQNEIMEKGKELSKQSNGAKKVFINHAGVMLKEVGRKINDQDSQTLEKIKVELKATLEKTLDNNENNKENELKNNENRYEIEKKALDRSIEFEKEKKDELAHKKNELLELTSEKKNIENDIKSDKEILVSDKFWSVPVIIRGCSLILFFCYLSFFFASSFWKLLFETSLVEDQTEKGIKLENPTVFDPGAIAELFSEGISLGIVGTLFFIIPVYLVSLKYLHKRIRESIWLEILVGWIIGLFILDCITAYYLTQSAYKLSCLKDGSNCEPFGFKFLQQGEFYLVFLFGAFPLLITKLLIGNIIESYESTQSIYVDKEKHKKLYLNQKKLVDIDSKITKAENEIKLEEEKIDRKENELKNKMNSIDAKMKNQSISINEHYKKRENIFKEITNLKISKLKYLTTHFSIFESRLVAFKEGFVSHIFSYYSESEANSRTVEIENEYAKWKGSNFYFNSTKTAVSKLTDK